MKARWYAAGLTAVLLLALALRLIGLAWGSPHLLPSSLNVDEGHVVDLAGGLVQRFLTSGSLDPQASTYGALPIYLLAASTAMAKQVLIWLKLLLPLPFDSAPMVYIGRLLSVLASLVTVWLTAELARRLFGRTVALLSALLLAICLLSVREAHFATVDTLLVAMMALTLLLGERISSRGAWRDYMLVGVAIALAAAVKVVAVLLVAPVLVAHWAYLWGDGSAPKSHWTTNLTRLLIAGVVAAAMWLILNPYALLDPAGYFWNRHNSVLTQFLMVRGDLPLLYTLQFDGTIPFLYVVTNWLYWGMGFPLQVLALAGIGYSLWCLLSSLRLFRTDRERRAQGIETTGFADAYLLSWFLIYFVTVGSWYAKFMRYALPLMPVLCLLAGRLLVALWQRGGGLARGLSAAITVSVVGVSLAYTIGYLNIYRQPDVRRTAAAWVQRHIPAGSSIFVEDDKGLFLHDDRYRGRYGLTGYTWQIWNPYEIDGVRGVRYHPPLVSEERTRAYLNRLLNTDYVMISSFWYERFTAAAARFPVQAEFYRRLFSGQAGYRLVRTFQVYPQLGPFIWHDDEAEITFRLFDHPAVYFFAKESSVDLLSPQEATSILSIGRIAKAHSVNEPEYKSP